MNNCDSPSTTFTRQHLLQPWAVSCLSGTFFHKSPPWTVDHPLLVIWTIAFTLLQHLIKNNCVSPSPTFYSSIFTMNNCLSPFATFYSLIFCYKQLSLPFSNFLLINLYHEQISSLQIINLYHEQLSLPFRWLTSASGIFYSSTFTINILSKFFETLFKNRYYDILLLPQLFP